MGTLWDVLKDKLSSAKDGAEKFAKIAIDKTTNVVDITKLNIAKNEVDSKINKLYVKIGEMIYDKYKNGEVFGEDICEIMVEIDKFKAELEELEEQIASLKSTSACPECGQQNDKSSEYCSKCGAKLIDDDEEQEEDQEVDIISEDE